MMAVIRRKWLFSPLLKISVAINSDKLSCCVSVSGRLLLTPVSRAARGVADRRVLICRSSGNTHLCSGGKASLIQCLAWRQDFIQGMGSLAFLCQWFSKPKAWLSLSCHLHYLHVETCCSLQRHLPPASSQW